MGRILVIEDQPSVRLSVRRFLEKSEGHTCAAMSELPAATSIPDEYDAALVDVGLLGVAAAERLDATLGSMFRRRVIITSGAEHWTQARALLQEGVFACLPKPLDFEALGAAVRRCLQGDAAVRVEIAPAPERTTPTGILYRSAAMEDVQRRIELLAPHDITVLITGESGTGKELVARAIHGQSPRRDEPFEAIHCGAIPSELLESELFGHERGAFTDAKERRIGKFEAANGGTLFLDEVGELAAGVQAKFLRALQERRVERVGGAKPIDVDVRVIAATNRDLQQDVESGRFRADLFYRINVVPIDLPPLPDRREDIRLLAEHFLERARRAAGRGPRKISRAAMSALERHPWPGNVRELENAIEHAVALAEGEVLEETDLPASVIRAGHVEGLREAVSSGRVSLEEATRDFERALLLQALESARWNQTRAAEKLQITRRLLKLKMDRCGIEPPGS